MENLVPLTLFALVVIAAIVAAIFGYIAETKRRDALAKLAAKLGLGFSESKNYELAAQYSFLDKLAQGDNRYLFNTLSGVYRGERVLISDYHYETHSTDSKGRRHTTHHYLAVFILRLPATFPELIIAPEGIFSKIAQALGFDDIDFESHEFSRSFCVRSRDKKFAYDICNARMMDYLLGNKDLAIEIERDSVALVFGSRMAVELIEMNLGRLLEIRSRMPNYLFAGK